MASRFAALALVLLLAACGNGDGKARYPGTFAGRAVGQEIWITYFSPDHVEMGRRTGRPKEEARALAEKLRAEVLAGADIGELARAHSNAPGGSALGYSSELPRDRTSPDARDKALLAAKVGEVTEIVDWNAGFWFAKRVDFEKGASLKTLFELHHRERVRFRAIALLYVGAHVDDPEAREEISRSRAQALAAAEGMLRQIQEGADFAEMARLHSADEASAKRGGLVHALLQDGSWTEWVWRGYAHVPAPVLDVVFSAEPGAVHPEVIVTERGLFVVRVEERKVLPR